MVNRPQSGSSPIAKEDGCAIQNGAHDETALHDLEVGGNHTEACPRFDVTNSSNSSIIKLNNGDVLYMREINR